MSIDLEQIRKNYKEADDSKIIYLARNEVGSLHPDVIQILADEIQNRELDPDLIQGIIDQTRELTEEEVVKLKFKITGLPCPECRQKTSPLVGTLLREVKSFIVITTYNKRGIISCKLCGNRERKETIMMTALFGWWGFPWGFFRTAQTLAASVADKKRQDVLSDEILVDFVARNIGSIRALGNKEDELIDFIYEMNRGK